MPSVTRANAEQLSVEWLGRVAYADALECQLTALEARQRGETGDRLLLLEHPAVVTLGRSAHEENLRWGRAALAERGIEIHAVQRGGDVTYHAPGQLVGYLVMDLKARGTPDLHAFVRNMEAALMTALARFDLPTRRFEGRSGVFIDRDGATSLRGFERGGRERKIASIGVGVKRWVSYHGFALNVTSDLSGFDAIVPCGLPDVTMTSVAHEVGEGPMGLDAQVREAVGEAFRDHFGGPYPAQASGTAERC